MPYVWVLLTMGVGRDGEGEGVYLPEELAAFDALEAREAGEYLGGARKPANMP